MTKYNQMGYHARKTAILYGNACAFKTKSLDLNY